MVVIIPTLFMGSLIMESFFGIPGLGSYTIDAIQQQDFEREQHRLRILLRGLKSLWQSKF